MEGQYLMYEGVKLYVLYTNIPEDKADLSVGYLGKDPYKSIDRILIGGVDITSLMEQHLETIEEKIND